MQIIQFLVGVPYAGAHSFISYSIPVQVVSFSSSPASSAIASTATAVSAGIGTFIKKFLLRAAAEGLAKNVVDAPRAQPPMRPVPIYRTEYQTISCIDTSGQTFAIWLNVLYLAPLTWLFVRFFIRSYLRRTGATAKSRAREERTGIEAVRAVAGKAGFDALKGVRREVGKGMNGSAVNGGVMNGSAMNGSAMNGHGHKTVEMNGKKH
jgi:GNS1/SUR4 family